ncbi:hypothetical protein QL285_077542 [Trifolium repens]|nr:hypothetical protein QL285_077486 [Trifolium repens]KAK2376785.1 hypothetical protein QL285_077542 [Trifolium repens]
MMSSQVESNMRVESSIEVVTGGGLLDSSTVVESNMSFMELLATCEIGFKGSTESRTNVSRMEVTTLTFVDALVIFFGVHSDHNFSVKM